MEPQPEFHLFDVYQISALSLLFNITIQKFVCQVLKKSIHIARAKASTSLVTAQIVFTGISGEFFVI